MQLCGAQKEDSAFFSSSLPSNPTGAFRDFSRVSSKHLLYSMRQVANKGADCVFKTITEPQPIFREQDHFSKRNRNRPTKLDFVHGSLKSRKRYSNFSSVFLL